MKRRTSPIAPILAVMSLLLPRGLHAEPRQIEAGGSYVHESTHRRFPKEVGEFRRERILQYDQAGRDISVGYNLETPDRLIAATMYVYPLPSRGFAEELAEVRTAHATFRLEFEQALMLERGARGQPCRMAGFSYEDTFAHRYGPVTSYLLICDDPPWRLKWRFTHLPTSDKGISKVMKDLAASLTVRE